MNFRSLHTKHIFKVLFISLMPVLCYTKTSSPNCRFNRNIIYLLIMYLWCYLNSQCKGEILTDNYAKYRLNKHRCQIQLFYFTVIKHWCRKTYDQILKGYIGNALTTHFCVFKHLIRVWTTDYFFVSPLTRVYLKQCIYLIIFLDGRLYRKHKCFVQFEWVHLFEKWEVILWTTEITYMMLLFLVIYTKQ